MTRRQFLSLLAGAAAASAPAAWALLGGRRTAAAGPPEIRYGRDRCEQCGMIISDARYASASLEAGEAHRFDDIGCLLRRSGAAIAGGRAAAYVHDASTEAWLEAGRAVFVRSSQIRTPMSSGIAAYASEAAALGAHPGLSPMALDALLASAGAGHP